MTKNETLSALAAEMNKAEIAMIFYKGAAKRKWAAYRKNCWEAIKAIDPVEASNTKPTLAEMEALLAELGVET